MRIGVTKEIKNHEYRVGLTPGGVSALVRAGHAVMVEANAGAGVGFTDEMYVKAGGHIIATAAEIFSGAEMIVKVKEPQPVEYRQLRSGQILFTYLHLAPDPEQTKGLIASDCVAIAYETVTDDHGRPAAAQADVGSCRTDVDSSRRARPGKGAGRSRRIALRCPRCAACQGAGTGAGVSWGSMPPGWPLGWVRKSPSWIFRCRA
jgi:alanine dehydrogenase